MQQIIGFFYTGMVGGITGYPALFVVVAMVANAVAGFAGLGNDFRVLGHIISNQKEGSLRANFIQFTQNPWRNFGGWTIVKRQVDCLFIIRQQPNAIGVSPTYNAWNFGGNLHLLQM